MIFFLPRCFPWSPFFTPLFCCCQGTLYFLDVQIWGRLFSPMIQMKLHVGKWDDLGPREGDVISGGVPMCVFRRLLRIRTVCVLRFGGGDRRPWWRVPPLFARFYRVHTWRNIYMFRLTDRSIGLEFSEEKKKKIFFLLHDLKIWLFKESKFLFVSSSSYKMSFF